MTAGSPRSRVVTCESRRCPSPNWKTLTNFLYEMGLLKRYKANRLDDRRDRYPESIR